MTAPAARRLPRSAGFTLIELLVVIAILSTVTLLAFDVSTDDRAQLRYDDTRARLAALERAILGRLGPADPAAVGGFVADNGRLPENVAELLSADALMAQTALTPVFDPLPDTSTCANNGGETTPSPFKDASSKDIPAALLVKGHRGNYLGGLAFNGRFRDGWGNEAADATADAANFGWSFVKDTTVTPAQLRIASLGTDNVADSSGGGTGYAADTEATIRTTDWQVPIGGWSVQVFNKSGNDISTSANLSASLIVFVNDSSGGHWQRLSSDTVTVDCLDGTGDGLVNSTSCSASFTLTFSSGCYPTDPSSNHGTVPQGRHLLVLVDSGSTGGTWSSADKVYRRLSTSLPAVTQITAVAGMALPAARLEIR